MSRGQEHWLRRPQTIRWLWRGGIAVLALTIIAGRLIEQHPHFKGEALFAFDAWFGFGSCVAMVIGAKALGALLKRRDTYYERD